MDELPSEAKALLELARDGHDPPDGAARVRVRSRLAAAMTAASASGTQAANVPAAGAPPFTGAGEGVAASWFGGKAWLAAALLAGVGGATLIASNQSRPAPSAAPAHHLAEAAVLRETAPPAPPVQAQPEVPPRVEVSATRAELVAKKWSGRTAARRGAAPSDLTHETELLSRAARLLVEGDAAGAKALLEQHRRSFPRPQLREEREGLLVLAHCLEAPSAARAQARHYIAGAPASVLASRIARACSLSQ